MTNHSSRFIAPQDSLHDSPIRRDVLLVDDDTTFVDTFGALLRKAGYAVIARLTEADGLAYLSTDMPDILITDLRLGDGDGWNLVRDARARQPAIPIVIVTGWSYNMDAAADYDRLVVFEKPFDPDLLLQYLDTIPAGPAALTSR